MIHDTVALPEDPKALLHESVPSWYFAIAVRK
jgi:hypothetical protein